MALLSLSAALSFCCLTVTAAQNGLVGISFTKEPQSLVVPPGDEVVFTCGVNLDADRLTWLHDWKPLEPGSDPNIDVSPGRLLIRVGQRPEVYNRQTGEYRCMAQIAPIGLTSLPATLSIAHILPFARRDNATLESPPGGIVSIQCPPPTSAPPASVQFYRDGQLVTPRGDSVTLLPGGRLHLSDVSETQAGTYSCSASNHLTGQTVQAPFVTRLEVRRPAGGAPPRLVVPPEPIYTARAGSTLRMECVSEGWPRPLVGWKRVDGRWSKDRYIQHAASLEIRALRKSDQGSYVCDVANRRGSLSAATIVRVIEPPSVQTSQQNLTVPEGSAAELRCSGRGQPPPQLQWVLNGRPVLGGRRPRVAGGRLQFDAVTRQDAGLYQCFGHSESGDDKAAVLLKVIPRQSMSSGVLPPDVTVTSTVAPTERQATGRRRGNGNRNRDGELMVPPSAPSVYPISESSVMLKWDVPENDGLAVLFFKIQYRRAPRRRHDWQTHDSDVPGTARSFEVDGLEVGAKYKFRVLAVYENKDNKHGPNSRKVKMTRMRKKAKPPGAPEIISHSPQSPSAIEFTWKYDFQATPIEGYFIFYRDTTMAGDYAKVTVLGERTKQHILTSLLPGTTYDIKLQAFNLEGGVSKFSPIVIERTEDSPDAPTTEPPGGGRHTVPIVTTRGVDRSRLRLYAIVGGVLGLLLLLALLFALVYYCRSRAGGKHDEAKFGDTSQAMHLQQQQPFTVSDREMSVARLRRQGSRSGSDGELAVTPLRQAEPPATPPPPPLPFKQRASAISETSFGAMPVSIPVVPPCCGEPSGTAAVHAAPGTASTPPAGAAVLNNNKYAGDGGDTVERRRRILRRKDSIEAQRHRLSGR